MVFSALVWRYGTLELDSIFMNENAPSSYKSVIIMILACANCSKKLKPPGGQC
jgi:hypothetical protein